MLLISFNTNFLAGDHLVTIILNSMEEGSFTAETAISLNKYNKMFFYVFFAYVTITFLNNFPNIHYLHIVTQSIKFI